MEINIFMEQTNIVTSGKFKLSQGQVHDTLPKILNANNCDLRYFKTVVLNFLKLPSCCKTKYF